MSSPRLFRVPVLAGRHMSLLALSLLSAALLAGNVFAAETSPDAKGTVETAAGIPKVIAHRGGARWAPENTLAAFRKCIESGVYGIELDIQQCKSGELVVLHDEELSRTTNGAGFLKDKTYEELKKLDAGSWFGDEFKGEPIPLLNDVLRLVDGQLVLNIEIKNTPVEYPGIEDALIKVLADYKHPETIIVSSFDHDVLKRIHEKAPSYKLALLGDPIISDIGDYASRVGASYWHPYFGSMRKDVIDRAHEAKLSVNVWTVDKPKDWQSMVAMGVDGIVTDDPTGLGEFLSTRRSEGVR